MTIQSLPLLHVIEPIPASDSALAALNLMLDLAINHLPVVDAHGHYLGMLTLGASPRDPYGYDLEIPNRVIRELQWEHLALMLQEQAQVHIDVSQLRAAIGAMAARCGGWEPATARLDGTSVVLSAATVPHPVAVRFAWSMLAEPNLMNAAGLPASAFRERVMMRD